MIDRGVIAAEGARLRRASAEDILAWAAARFGGRLALTLSFSGPGGVVLAHMVASIDRSIPVLFLDTGFLFPETVALRDTVAERYGLTVVTLTPETDPGPLYMTDPDACCAIRKVEPMQRALTRYDAWASALRRDQSATRADTDVIEYHDSERGAVVKVHPLALWSRDDVWSYIRKYDVPYHPLLERGYASIGCWPCTRPTGVAEDERAGRWSGTQKTECGLHTFTKRGSK